MRTSNQILARHLAALRAVAVFTLLLGLAYPLTMVAAAQLPGLDSPAEGSLLTADGAVVGSRLLGQSFTDDEGDPIATYFQSRPSMAGDGYDPTSTSASNLGPEDVVDLPGRQSLLSQVCARSRAVGELEDVDGRRPYCTEDGVGAVLGVYYDQGLAGSVTRVVSLNQHRGVPFLDEYRGVPVELASLDEEYAGAVVVPLRGDAPARPVVPADAVTASGSGLDPHISPEYALLQAPRVARERGVEVTQVRSLIEEYTHGRTFGLLGEPAVNVLELNLALDEQYPVD